MGEREVASAPFLSVVKSTQPVDHDPALLLDVRSMTLSAPRLDQSVTGLQQFRPPALFQLETELIAKYKERLDALEKQEKLKADVHSAASESIRSSKKLELDQAKLEEIRKLKAQADRREEEDSKIAQVVQETAGKPSDARFFLESAKWDVRNAIQLLRQNTSAPQRETVAISFRLPTGESFSDNFDVNELMWGMLTVVYRKLQERKIKRGFQLKVRGSMVSEETLSATKFKEAGIRGSCSVEVVWSN